MEKSPQTNENQTTLDETRDHVEGETEDSTGLSGRFRAAWKALWSTLSGFSLAGSRSDSAPEISSETIETSADEPNPDADSAPRELDVRGQLLDKAPKSEGLDTDSAALEESGETIQLRPGRVSGSDVLGKVSFLLRLGEMVRLAAGDLNLKRKLDLGEGRSSMCRIELQDNFALRQDSHLPFTIVLTPQIRSDAGDWQHLPQRKRPVGFEELSYGNARQSLDLLTEWADEEVTALETELRASQ
jgi:hypothetical protein